MWADDQPAVRKKTLSTGDELAGTDQTSIQGEQIPYHKDQDVGVKHDRIYGV